MHGFIFSESVLKVRRGHDLFEREYLFDNSTGFCHDLKLGVYGYEPIGISYEHFKHLILSH